MDNNEIEYNQNNNNSYMGNIQQFSNEQPSMTPYNQNKRPVNFPNQQIRDLIRDISNRAIISGRF